MWVTADTEGDEVVLFIVLGIAVVVAILAYLPLLEFIRVACRGPDSLGVALDANC